MSFGKCRRNIGHVADAPTDSCCVEPFAVVGQIARIADGQLGFVAKLAFGDIEHRLAEIETAARAFWTDRIRKGDEKVACTAADIEDGVTPLYGDLFDR